ncbi:hypothetical protein [Methylobacterium trifolii]|uniref:hypothetical protein n=1 Tax=Methylobacterium trifolii TaxID=1003092 RepID=UPI001EDE5D61|nr:hypothetical protein [Methylobacterium trifolii]
MDEILDLIGALLGGVYWLARGVIALLEGLVALADIADLFGGSGKTKKPADAPDESDDHSPPE